MPPGKLITFEGIECSGKGTQITKLLEYFIKCRLPIFVTHEPGGTQCGEALRALLKHPEITFAGLQKAFTGHSDFPSQPWKGPADDRAPATELFMFLAARAEFIDKVIFPRISEGVHVISDRLHDSTRAYQGGGRFYSRPEMIEVINRNNFLAMQGLRPDITFLLDITVETMLNRMEKEDDEKNSFFEKKFDPLCFERVRQEYLQIQSEEPQRVVLIDGSQSKEIVFEKIKSHCQKLFDLTDVNNIKMNQKGTGELLC